MRGMGRCESMRGQQRWQNWWDSGWTGAFMLMWIHCKFCEYWQQGSTDWAWLMSDCWRPVGPWKAHVEVQSWNGKKGGNFGPKSGDSDLDLSLFLKSCPPTYYQIWQFFSIFFSPTGLSSHIEKTNTFFTGKNPQHWSFCPLSSGFFKISVPRGPWKMGYFWPFCPTTFLENWGKKRGFCIGPLHVLSRVLDQLIIMIGVCSARMSMRHCSNRSHNICVCKTLPSLLVLVRDTRF